MSRSCTACRRDARAALALALSVVGTARARAAEPVVGEPAPPAPRQTDKVVVSGTRPDSATEPGRASSSVTRPELEERAARSAPDALRYEPGVYVQQSAHGQASPYVRGRTGQQTVVLFDGIRMNTSTWRQGPNQYFFTVDADSIRAIEVTRGGASTLYGSDAIAGVILAKPFEPQADGGTGWTGAPRLLARAANADGSYGARLQLDAAGPGGWRVLAGGGYRHAGLLRGGGLVAGQRRDEALRKDVVPRLREGSEVQLGTGYDEMTGDLRLTYRLPGAGRLVAAGYLYRQFDSPRTDQCPASYAPIDECLNYDEQFRSLAYLAYDGALGGWARHGRLALSFQRQHERRTLRTPGATVDSTGGRDDVNTLGALARLETRPFALGTDIIFALGYGADGYFDFVDSAAWVEEASTGAVRIDTRGQYVAGSRFSQGGAFLQAELHLGRDLTARTGGRAGWAHAAAAGDVGSGTLPVQRTWISPAWNAQLECRPTAPLALLATYDRSFRAPNLDDLTSRQLSGPGFQFENAALGSEVADGVELGAQLGSASLEGELWVFRSLVRHAIARARRELCPPLTPL